MVYYGTVLYTIQSLEDGMLLVNVLSQDTMSEMYCSVLCYKDRGNLPMLGMPSKKKNYVDRERSLTKVGG